MNLTEVALAYFVVGAVMFGGGAIAFEDTGLTQVMLTNDGGDVSVGDGLATQWENITTSPTIFDSIGGAMIMIWDILVLLFGAAFWPVLVMVTYNVPTTVTTLLGGTLAFAFVLAGIKFIRSSI